MFEFCTEYETEIKINVLQIKSETVWNSYFDFARNIRESLTANEE